MQPSLPSYTVRRSVTTARQVPGLLRFVLAGTLSMVCVGLYAQPQADPDWPCVQVLVPEISAAVLWPVPIEEAQRGQWRNMPATRKLAYRLGTLETVGDADRAAMESFAQALPPKQLSGELSMLAEGVLEVANRQRADFIRGIKRYTRQQIVMADKIEASLNTLASEPEEFADAASRADFEENLHWKERIYDQRERAIGSLCEQPVELEQSLSEILRELAQYLP